jgi:NADPH:quinone reductase-like Zn-dependent oxidoreductase
MKAAIVHEKNAIPVYGEFETPEPRPGEQLVSVIASALSPLARGRASGAHYSSSGQFPFVAGVDGVGRREDGTRVYFVLPRAPFGAFAEKTVVPGEQCLVLPDDIDDVTAAAIANPGMSSWAALSERARFVAGETILVNGATGASGRLAVQIARFRGAKRVIATGRDVKALESLGADMAIALTDDTDALETRFKEAFAEGIDVVLDYLWGKSAERLLIAGAKAGPDGIPIRFVQIGTASGADITLPGAVLRSSAIELMGSGIGSVPLPRLVAAVGGVLAAAKAGQFSLPSRTLALSEVERGWSLPDRARTVFEMA